MHNGRRGNNEHAKDFKKSMKSLINYCRPYLVLILIAIILAMFSSILSIIGPDKLRDITNTITNGLITGIDLNKVKNILISIAMAIFYLELLMMLIP